MSASTVRTAGRTAEAGTAPVAQGVSVSAGHGVSEALADGPVFTRLLNFLRKLSDQKLAFDLRHSRDDAVMVEINVPGARWEVEFLEDGDVDVEVFTSDGAIHDEDWIDKLLAENAE